MSTQVERFRDHCRRMAGAQHKPECPSLTAREPYWPMWAPITDAEGKVVALAWRGPKPKWEPPKCDGCLSDSDRDLFAQLASEAERYVQGDLLEDA